MFEESDKKEERKVEKKLIALKDFKCSHKGEIYDIKKGDEVLVPLDLLPNLKTEKVIG